MTDSTDTLIAHIMVSCPMRKETWVSVNGTCKPCGYCQGIIVDPQDANIIGVRCTANKEGKSWKD